MVPAGSRPAGPEQPWGAGGRQGRGEHYGAILPMGAAGSRQARPGAALEELGGHQGREEQPIRHI